MGKELIRDMLLDAGLTLLLIGLVGIIVAGGIIVLTSLTDCIINYIQTNTTSNMTTLLRNLFYTLVVGLALVIIAKLWECWRCKKHD